MYMHVRHTTYFNVFFKIGYNLKHKSIGLFSIATFHSSKHYVFVISCYVPVLIGPLGIYSSIISFNCNVGLSFL